jgi:hypothetical protein
MKSYKLLQLLPQHKGWHNVRTLNNVETPQDVITNSQEEINRELNIVYSLVEKEIMEIINSATEEMTWQDLLNKMDKILL